MACQDWLIEEESLVLIKYAKGTAMQKKKQQESYKQWQEHWQLVFESLDCPNGGRKTRFYHGQWPDFPLSGRDLGEGNSSTAAHISESTTGHTVELVEVTKSRIGDKDPADEMED